MRKALSLVFGFSAGAAVGAILGTLLAPASREQLAANFKRANAETMAVARQASAQRRAELEADLERMQRQSE